MSSATSDFLLELSRQFAAQLPVRLKAIRAQFESLAPTAWQPAEAEALHRLIHGLTGSAGTFGMMSVSDAALVLETKLSDLLKSGGVPAGSEWHEVAAALESVEVIAYALLESDAEPAARPGLPQPSAAGLNSESQRKVRILIVDDDPADLLLLEKILGGMGYQELVMVSDPRDVLDRYREARPDLILLDINMPHLDGYQVMAQLKALDDTLLPPIIILTAQRGKDDLLRALDAGARDFITKPLDRSELMMRVRNLLDAQLAHRLLHGQKAVLEGMVRTRTEELHRTRLQVVQRLGKAAEYRDEETGTHILRMSHISALLAQASGWSEADCDLILNASPMHDIGKLGIPDAVMLKPGKFEPHEWEIMKTHAAIGAKLLEGDDSDLMRMAREIALTHHEKWDGSGYPNGLAGGAIPQAGRIAALADVFDALTSVRPYKKAWPVEAALDLIQENRGRHFDPALVDLFKRELSGILDIRQRFAESPS